MTRKDGQGHCTHKLLSTGQAGQAWVLTRFEGTNIGVDEH